jgi:hypothetical protein
MLQYRGMADETMSNWPGRPGNLEAGPYVFGATGGSEESPTRHMMAADQDGRQSTPGYPSEIENFGGMRSESIMPSREVPWCVGGECMVQGWQSAATACRTLKSFQSYIEDPSSGSYMRADEHDQTLPTQSADRYNGQPWSGPWDSSVPSRYQPRPQHTCNTVPSIQINAPTGGSGVADLNYANMWLPGPYTLEITYDARPEARMEGWSALCLSPERFDQTSSSRRFSRGSVASAPGRLPGGAFDPTAAAAEDWDWSSQRSSSK